jgi:hypothetical protein
MIMTDTTIREVPPEIFSLLRAWVKRRGHHIFIHYSIGVLGILASVAAAADAYSRWASLWMVVSSFCIAFVGFGNPRREYDKFARAVRVLYIATLRYRYGQIEMKELLKAVERGETIIQSYESDDGPSLRQIRDGLA